MARQLLIGIAVVFIQVFLDSVSGGQCPLGFMGHGGSCYYFSHTKATFWEAEKICRHFEGYLAKITTKEENDFIRNFALRHGKAPNYWLGGTDLRVEGTWTWEHKMSKFNYSNWYPGQPNNGKEGKEHCLEIRKELSYMWNDYECRMSGHFVCEHDRSFKCVEHTASLEVEDCKALQNKLPNSVDGVYRLQPLDGKGSFQVFCDMSKHDGGWVVIQRRYSGSEDFYRTWNEYKEGFGELTGEFWLGNEKIHRLTKQKRYELRIDLEMMTGTKHRFALYDTFSLSGKSDYYKLHIGGYSGGTGDFMKYHNNHPFSTKDKDLDAWGSNCAVSYKGAWWYNRCYGSNLNGAANTEKGFCLHSKIFEEIKASTMKIRPFM